MTDEIDNNIVCVERIVALGLSSTSRTSLQCAGAAASMVCNSSRFYHYIQDQEIP